MFCPECGAEYREGFGRCVDCEVDLVAEAPPPAARPAPAARQVTVLRSGDPTVLAMAKSLLQDAGIALVARGEGLQDLFALGRLGTGSSPVVGPAEIRVSAADAAAARALLRDLESGVESPSDDEFGDEEDDEIEEPELAAERAVEPADDASVAAPPARARRAFRALVLGELLVWFFSLAAWEPFARRVPEPLWDQIDAALPSAVPVNVFNDSYPTFLLLWVAASIGLLAFWSPSRYLYVLLWGWSLFGAAFGPAQVDYGLPAFLSMLDHLLSGAIIALAFASPLRGAFARRPRPPS
jgi:Putative prokaryotic signal transducing protein